MPTMDDTVNLDEVPTPPQIPGSSLTVIDVTVNGSPTPPSGGAGETPNGTPTPPNNSGETTSFTVTQEPPKVTREQVNASSAVGMSYVATVTMALLVTVFLE